jgi:hypothetical protein
MRISQTMPYALQGWEPAARRERDDRVKDIYEFRKGGSRVLQQQCDEEGRPIHVYDDKGKALGDDARAALGPRSHPGRPDLCECIGKVVVKDPLLNVVFTICKRDADDWMSVMQHFCRMSSSCPRFCECLYFYGPSKTGKDAVAAAIEAQFGDRAGGVEETYFVSDGKPSVTAHEDCCPYAAALAGKLVCLVPDHPKIPGTSEGTPLDMAKLKPMMEQSGAKVTKRGCGQNPVRTRPSYEVVIFSNGAPEPDSKAPEDKRRLNCFEMRSRFADSPDEGEAKDNAEIKADLKKGRYNSNWFHAVRPWYKCLLLYTTNIPRSPNVHEATDAAFQTATIVGGEVEETREAAFVRKTFAPTGDLSEVTAESEVKKTWMKEFGSKLSQVTTTMRGLGFIFGGNSGYGKRFVTFNFGGAPPAGGRKMVKSKA